MKKYSSIALCLTMLFLTACKNNQPTPVPRETEEVVASTDMTDEVTSEISTETFSEETAQEEIKVEGHYKNHIIYCPYESGEQEWSVFEFDYKDFS